MKINIFTAVKNRCILHGRVFVMLVAKSYQGVQPRMVLVVIFFFFFFFFFEFFFLLLRCCYI